MHIQFLQFTLLHNKYIFEIFAQEVPVLSNISAFFLTGATLDYLRLVNALTESLADIKLKLFNNYSVFSTYGN